MGDIKGESCKNKVLGLFNTERLPIPALHTQLRTALKLSTFYTPEFL